MSKVAVVALGGNAITRSGQAGTYDEHWANVTEMMQAKSAPAIARQRDDFAAMLRGHLAETNRVHVNERDPIAIAD